jgi:hypothetical protein
MLRPLVTVFGLLLLASEARAQVTYDPATLAAAKARVKAGDAALRPAFVKLIKDADKALAAKPAVVTDKRTLLAPTNDPHDYYSLSPYWWPDPSKPDGLPYIRRDGETNPESKRDLDQPRVAQMGGNSIAMALAWYFTGDEKYAAGAARQLRAWFLDPATRMTPHLRYAQAVRGNPAERGSGIIDTRWFVEATDAARLLEGSKSWTPNDAAAMRDWTRQYVQWLWTSKNGQDEHKARNNHGSWYAAQVASLALFAGDTTIARTLVDETKPRLGWQITPQGEQPIENERTRSFHYAGFNVEALSRVATVAKLLGTDLWRYQAPEGGSLRRAIDHLAKYAPEPKTWPGQQIDDVDLDLLLVSFRRANAMLGEPAYAQTIGALPASLTATDRSALLWPDAGTPVRKDQR